MSLPESYKKRVWYTVGRPEVFVDIEAKWLQHRAALRLLPERPLISIVIPFLRDEKEDDLRKTLESIRSQSYPFVEIIVVADENAQVPEEWLKSSGDISVRLVRVSEPCAETLKNRGSAFATGQWISFLSTGEELNPFALYLMVLATKSGADVLYSHEISTLEGKQRFLSKPRFSWFTLLHWNFIGHFWMVKRDLFVSFERAHGRHAEHLFLLGLQAKEKKFELVPFFLCHRTSEADLIADETLAEGLRTHFRKILFPADVKVVGETAEKKLSIVPRLAARPTVSAIICFKNRSDWTIKSVVAACQHAGNVELEIILVNNGSDPAELAKVQVAVQEQQLPARIVDYPQAFNYADMHNRVLLEEATGEYIFFLNNDVFLEGGTIEEMAAWAQFDWVGTVGIRLHYGGGALQHAGIRAHFGNLFHLVKLGHDRDERFFAYGAKEVFCNTFAACLVKRKTYAEMGGLSPLDLPNAMGDVAFNFDCLRRGQHNLYLGSVHGTHLESASRGANYEYQEEFLIEREYPEILGRMLREDLGFDRVANVDVSLKETSISWVAAKIRRHAPGLGDLRRTLKQVKKDIDTRGLHVKDSAMGTALGKSTMDILGYLLPKKSGET